MNVEGENCVDVNSEVYTLTPQRKENEWDRKMKGTLFFLLLILSR